MTRLLAVDCDNTVVFMDWGKWKSEQDGVYDPLDYWRSPTLYDNLQPMEGSVEALRSLSQYFGIVFVSRLKGWHHRSKVYFLKEYFPFMQGFVGTHEKWLLQDSFCALIDDDINNLDKWDFHKRVLFGGESARVNLSFSKWDDEIVQTICERYL